MNAPSTVCASSSASPLPINTLPSFLARAVISSRLRPNPLGTEAANTIELASKTAQVTSKKKAH
jgi:hypothetical protein